MAERSLDVITLGRVSVDLYGEQIGGRLEDMASFAKYIGGCPANIAVGAARLGLRAGLISAVGDEHMGRFVREQLEREGVDTSRLKTDPTRLTALVILGVRDETNFPLIFYRESCADMGLVDADIDESHIASSRSLVITGTHLSSPSVAAASRRAMSMARRHGVKIILDVDYRPVLWGLTGHGAGERRFIDNASVTAHLQSILPGLDILVGTEEEFHIAGGSTDTLEALERIRALTDALILLKRGPEGCVAFPGAIGKDFSGGVVEKGFPVEVYNVLGAGDAFLAGFLRGHLRGETLEASMRIANACGALVVSRHSCAPACPTEPELRHFLDRGSPFRALRRDGELNDLHWSTTRRRDWPEICALAFDHRVQLERMAARNGAPFERITRFKELIFHAAQQAGGSEAGFGIILDARYGAGILSAVTGQFPWVARPIELPESTPLRFEGGADVGVTLREWPIDQVVKCLVYYCVDHPTVLRDEQERQIRTLFEASRATGHELMLEIIPSRENPGARAGLVAALERLYRLGIKPDWWKLAAPDRASGWADIGRVIATQDPYCRGVLMLGLDAPEAELAKALAAAASAPVCRGFAIGRSVFGEPAEAWFAGRIGDGEAVERMAATYGRLIGYWRDARHSGEARGVRESGRR